MTTAKLSTKIERAAHVQLEENMLEGFRAKDARAMAEEWLFKNEPSLDDLLLEIEVQAGKGEFTMLLDRPLHEWHRDSLVKRGFRVVDKGSMWNMGKGFYHLISWAK